MELEIGMRNKSEIDDLYKTLTKDKFKKLLANLEKCNIALSHLAFCCQSIKAKGAMQIPLERHPEKSFAFSVMKHKVTKEEIMVIEVLDKKATTPH